MKRRLPILFLLLFIGCKSGITTRPVNLNPFFNDNSSKIWMVNNVNLRNPEMEVATRDLRDVFIFYKSGRIIVQPLNSLGNRIFEDANYSIDSDGFLLKINFELSKIQWVFKIKSVSTNKVILQPLLVPNLTKDIELIPLPEL